VPQGDYRHRLTVETRTETSDGYDGFTEDWTAVESATRIAGRVRALAGQDLERARQVDPRAGYEVTVPFWRAYADALAGGRGRVIWHDTGAGGDRTLEVVEPPREVVHRQRLAMVCRELR